MTFTRTTSPPLKAKGSFHLICTQGVILNCFYEGVPFLHLNRAKRRAISWLAIWHFLKEWNYNSFWQGKQWRWLQSIPETNPFSSTSPSRPPTCQCRYLQGQSLQEQGCIFRLTCSHRELTEDHVLTSAYVKIFRTVTRNFVNRGVWRKTDCSWIPLNKYAMNIWLSVLRIRAHLSWRTGKHLHVFHVLRTYSTCSHPGW